MARQLWPVRAMVGATLVVSLPGHSIMVARPAPMCITESDLYGRNELGPYKQGDRECVTSRGVQGSTW